MVIGRSIAIGCSLTLIAVMHNYSMTSTLIKLVYSHPRCILVLVMVSLGIAMALDQLQWFYHLIFILVSSNTCDQFEILQIRYHSDSTIVKLLLGR